VGDPELLFLDEPTTGFDPAARRQAWDTIRDLRGLGKSILLTTHYMEEAQNLADRLAILRDGRIVATGSPRDLLSGAAAVEVRYRRNGEEIVLTTDEPTRTLHELTGQALAEGLELEDIEVRRRSLEDLYLELTREEAEVG
jgi:ABC-2 type transport system ATP-binding protein